MKNKGGDVRESAPREKAVGAPREKAVSARGCVPRLRFPKFTSAGDWQAVRLNDLLSLEYGSPLANEDRKGGVYPVVGSNGIVGYHDDFIVDGPAIVIGRKGSAGLVNWIDTPCFPIDTTYYVILREPQKHTLAFIKLILENCKLHEQKDHGAIPGLNRSEVYRLFTCVPNRDEQLKIAACLSSIDELIVSHSRKLEALKGYKVGLMQQLFPAEGETVPRLRFAEFRDGGRWEEKHLGSISSIVRGGSPRPIEAFLTSDSFGLNWLKIGDVDQDSKYVNSTQEKVLLSALTKTREIAPGDLILSNSMSFGRPYISRIKTCIHDGWIAVSNIEKNINIEFLYYSILSETSQRYFNRNAAGAVVQNLNAHIIKLLSVMIPPYPEQQKIASCLSSLDDLISAQSAKIETLKQHKRGLMQGLFPLA